MQGWEEQCQVRSETYLYHNNNYCDFFPTLLLCVQVVLRASAGMDYWEFAQFLSVIGLPRLKETQATLSSIYKPSDAITTVLSNIEQLLLKVSTSSRKLTFLENSALPAELHHLTPTVSDNLAMCECLVRQAKEREINIQPFSALYDLLPEEFRQILVLDKHKEDLSRRRTRAQLIFRLFELITINTVLREVLQCVSIHSV